MPRKPELPGVDALFQRPKGQEAQQDQDREEVAEDRGTAEETRANEAGQGPAEVGPKAASAVAQPTADASEAGAEAEGRGEAPPVKSTFYFSPDTVEALERAWFELRRRTGRKVSKSEIVDRVVRASTEDLDSLERLVS